MNLKKMLNIFRTVVSEVSSFVGNPVQVKKREINYIHEKLSLRFKNPRILATNKYRSLFQKFKTIVNKLKK